MRGFLSSFFEGAFLALVTITACATVPLPPGPGGDGCEAMCDNLARLQCPGAEGSPGYDEQYGTKDDVPCAQACQEQLEAEPTLTFDEACVAEARSCAEADACRP